MLFLGSFCQHRAFCLGYGTSPVVFVADFRFSIISHYVDWPVKYLYPPPVFQESSLGILEGTPGVGELIQDAERKKWKH
jgi:hypothetical protein